MHLGSPSLPDKDIDYEVDNDEVENDSLTRGSILINIAIHMNKGKTTCTDERGRDLLDRKRLTGDGHAGEHGE